MSTEFYTQEPFHDPHFPDTRGDNVASTGLFGIGLFLTILFIFFNILDSCRVSWYRAKNNSALLEVKQFDSEFHQRTVANHVQPDGNPGGNKDDTKSERERRQKMLDAAREKYNEVRPELVRAFTQAQLSFSYNQYWYYWGLFLGVVLLSMGSLGFLIGQGPTTRRIIGGAVLCLIVVWFVTFLIIKSNYASSSAGRFYL